MDGEKRSSGDGVGPPEDDARDKSCSTDTEAQHVSAMLYFAVVSYSSIHFVISAHVFGLDSATPWLEFVG